ncbi:TonB-dependent receptor [Fulvivirga sp. M361]|nr:TonB-dependent receptor [Fulvivirga sp. M361]
MLMRKFTKQINKCLVIFFLASGISVAYGQLVVSGVVKDADDNSGLPGVNVLVEGSKIGTITDTNGSYSLQVPSESSVLRFSFIGYRTIAVSVNSQSVINVVLEADVTQLEEIVVTGYGVQKKKEVTGAVGSIKSDAILKAPTSDLGTAMQGSIAGVNVQAADGRPGAAANIQIRGLGSINGGAAPLYVVDGIPFQGTPNIAPEQIESVDVLKDGASAAIYGVRASNGVILITTKKGQAGKMKVDLTAYKGVQNITSGTPLMDARQQLYAHDITLEALGREPVTFFLNPNTLDFNSDFVGDVQNQNAAIESYNLLVSGGQENITMSVNTNYFRQEGVLINSGFDRLSTRINGEFTKDKFRVFAGVGFTFEDQEQEPWALYEYAISQNPGQRGLFEIPTVGPNEVQIDGDNEILYGFLSRQLGNDDARNVNSSNIALNLEYQIIDGLKFQANLGRNSWNFRRKFFQPQYLVFNRDGDFSPTASRPQASLQETFTFNTRNTIESILSYNRSFGKHNLDVLLGVTYEEYESKNVGVGVNGLLSNDTRVLGAGEDGTPPTGQDLKNTLVGKLGRIRYNYNDRYLFSANVRYDGSSNFGPDNRYELFYGGSFGWNITEEQFFRNAGLDFLTNLKMRVSYGRVGNQNIGAYNFAAFIESGIDYPFGPDEDLGVGAIQRGYANPLVQWETNVSRNIGLDADLFEGSLNFTFDYYRNNKKDMLLSERLAPSTGTWQTRAENQWNSRTVNAGDMTNEGIELALSYRGQTSFGMKWQVAATFTRNINEITNLNGATGLVFGGGRPIVSNGSNTDLTTFLTVGREGGAFFLVQHDGVIKNNEQLDAYRDIDPSAQLGDMMYIDQNGDNTIDDLDRVYTGSGQPDFESGISLSGEFKGFDLFVQGYYSHGAEIYNGAKLYAYTQGRHLDQYFAWTPQNSDSDIPAFRQDALHANNRARSDYFLEDGTYFRVRNITLGYSVPQSILKGKMGRARVYFTAMNAFTLTDYEGYDPEVGGDGLLTRGVDIGNYPVARRFLFGVQIGL